jgi:hypothetical protein
VEDVVGLMSSFERMCEALINWLDRDEARALVTPKGPQRAPTGTGSIERELKKVKFPEFLGAMDSVSTKAWLDKMLMCFHFTTTTPT